MHLLDLWKQVQISEKSVDITICGAIPWKEGRRAGCCTETSAFLGCGGTGLSEMDSGLVCRVRGTFAFSGRVEIRTYGPEIGVFCQKAAVLGRVLAKGDAALLGQTGWEPVGCDGSSVRGHPAAGSGGGCAGLEVTEAGLGMCFPWSENTDLGHPESLRELTSSGTRATRQIGCSGRPMQVLRLRLPHDRACDHGAPEALRSG